MRRCKTNSYLDLDGPGEVGHVDVEGDVVVQPEVELLTGEAVAVLLDVGPRYDGHLLAWDGPSCRRTDLDKVWQWVRRGKLYRTQKTTTQSSVQRPPARRRAKGHRVMRLLSFFSQTFFIVENVNSSLCLETSPQVLSEVNESMWERESTQLLDVKTNTQPRKVWVSQVCDDLMVTLDLHWYEEAAPTLNVLYSLHFMIMNTEMLVAMLTYVKTHQFFLHQDFVEMLICPQVLGLIRSDPAWYHHQYLQHKWNASGLILLETSRLLSVKYELMQHFCGSVVCRAL